MAERSEFERDPALPEHRKVPVAKRRVADSRVASSLGYFYFGEAKEKSLAGRATPGQPNSEKPNH